MKAILEFDHAGNLALELAEVVAAQQALADRLTLLIGELVAAGVIAAPAPPRPALTIVDGGREPPQSA
jgi:hypothetical protein